MHKRKFDIITDSASDMPKEYYEKNDLICVPLGFTMNNVNYEGEHGEKITPKAFYDKLREGGMPTTYQVTAEQARGYIEPCLQRGRDVLIVCFSSALSGTAGSFRVAARELFKRYPRRKIKVVDSLCASMGEGLFLDYVVKKADEGASLEETAKYADNLKRRICHHFTVDSLFHLKRGGRVSGATAVIGSILKIKPVMKVDDQGKLTVVSKTMGRKKALAAVVENLFESMDMGENDPIFISHADCKEDVEHIVRLIRTRLPNVRIEMHYIGSVIGAHAGAGTIAVFHKGKCR